MIVKVIPQRKEPEITAQPWVVEHTVELSPGEFRYLKEHLLWDHPCIAEHASELHMDKHGITNGMLVLCEGIDDGILMNSEGASYARYAAYLSGARTLSLMDRYPILRDFCVQMDALVDKYVHQAISGQEDGQFTISYPNVDADIENEIFNDNLTAFDWRLFLDMLSARPEIDDMDTTNNEICLTVAPEFVQEQAPGMSM
ncbi:hypothetical protein D1841_09845 [Neglecta sp. X4]|uniref:DUF6329 domain-containing protein n=1 Tax=unclassified Neglectibacter TaxID=2632164 RepID=UPI00137079D4|nr:MULTISPECIES: DUF6329 domain-containing protein [unclassified Neglectibacter]NBI17989.1 hypothetical protein [Neglectibacter sp. 59]NBJ73586.1 hypothetical protein [Neglectibacter sp. X4]NCE81371.1 hypothetical protein [Neglectibacter sp. X58]